jgi:protein arginine N-methyltransferase 1
MYDIFDHGRMISDRVRGDAYARAIAATVRQNDIVVDLGTGTGVFAVLACRAGARRVYAIESADIIELAREVAAANGCIDRIEFIHSDSREIRLRDKADVIVADVRGVIPFFSTSLLALIDARERFLGRGGRIIPREDVVFAALVESPAAWAPHDQPWSASPDGIDLSAARRLAVNDMRKQMVGAEELLSGAVVVTTLDYASIASADFASRPRLTAARSGVAHGFALWFETSLAPGIGFSNAPGMPATIYGRSFVPFEAPVAMEAGDEVAIELAARLVHEEDYLWRWTTTLHARGNEPRTLFRQSTFFGYPRRFGVAE